jgi:hypothetical protein
MEPLRHDPLTKVQIKEALYEFLYTPVERSMTARLNALIVKNTLLGGYHHKSFHHKGVLYSCDDTPAPKRWNRLLPQLKPQVEEYLRDMEQMNRYELPFVLGYINQVLNSSKSFGDYLKLFPDSLHPPLQKLADSCPCHNQALSDEKIDLMTQSNLVPINMIKQRMVTNLLIT